MQDGNDLGDIDAALHAARAETTRPSLILVRTHIGFGSPNKHDSFEAHGSPLGVEEVRLTKQNLDWTVEPPFLIPEAAFSRFREAVARGARDEAASRARLAAYALEFPDLAEELQRAPRRAAARLGCGHSGISSRQQGARDARGSEQGDERHRAAPARIDRGLRGP